MHGRNGIGYMGSPNKPSRHTMERNGKFLGKGKGKGKRRSGGKKR